MSYFTVEIGDNGQLAVTIDASAACKTLDSLPEKFHNVPEKQMAGAKVCKVFRLMKSSSKQKRFVNVFLGVIY